MTFRPRERRPRFPPFLRDAFQEIPIRSTQKPNARLSTNVLFGGEWTPRITPHVRQLMPSNAVSSNPQSPSRAANGTDRRRCPMTWASDIPAQRAQQGYYGLPSPSPTRGVDPRVSVWFNSRDIAGGPTRPSATGSRRPMNERAVPVVPEPSCCTFRASTRSPATDFGKRQESDRGRGSAESRRLRLGERVGGRMPGTGWNAAIAS
jgi:hypothetical protein